MAALAESVGLEQLALTGLRMPLTVRPSEPMSDDELIAFSRCNRPYRVERNTNGELEIMSPLGFGGGAGVEILDRPDSVEAGEPVAGFRLAAAGLWDKA